MHKLLRAVLARDVRAYAFDDIPFPDMARQDFPSRDGPRAWQACQARLPPGSKSLCTQRLFRSDSLRALRLLR